MAPVIGIIADDFTGAVMVAGMLEGLGVHSPVLFHPDGAAGAGGAALIAAAREAARRTAAEALRQAEAQAETERQAMLAHTEEDCQALREAALDRMDGAVAYLLEKVVKR